jgi:hypothetical protein
MTMPIAGVCFDLENSMSLFVCFYFLFLFCVSLAWLILSLVQLSISALNETKFKDYYTRFIRQFIS